MKFGGTSVADISRIHNVAKHIQREIKAGNQVAVIVSAMAGRTNELVDLVKEAAKTSSDIPLTKEEQKKVNTAIQQEYDVVVSSGEQITVGLLAITLQKMNINARSWLGWQIPVITTDIHKSARISGIDGKTIIRAMEANEVAIIAGFQGVATDNTITTLGRGGSDTSAVAIAAAVKADRCDIYTDVDGVYTTDPRIEKKARAMPKISYEEMLELSSLGAKVMQVRSVELAMLHNVRTLVRSSFIDPTKEIIENGKILSGTLICSEEEILEKQTVTGIAVVKDEAKISLWDMPDRPGLSALIFGIMAKNSINVDMIIQNISKDGKTIDITFTVPAEDLEKAVEFLNEEQEAIGYKKLQSSGDLTKISIIGIGMRSHYGVASAAFTALAKNSINIKAITTSEIKISILIDSVYTELAVRTLHNVYGLSSDTE